LVNLSFFCPAFGGIFFVRTPKMSAFLELSGFLELGILPDDVNTEMLSSFEI